MRMARSTGTMSGLLIVPLAIWGGLIPFIGPYFDYSFGTNSTWHYTADRLWLNILPAAVALVGGVLLVGAATRVAGIVGGWLALVAGAWFVVGPAVSRTWEHGEGPIGRPLFGTARQALELIGYFYGLGALIVALAAFCIGRFASRPLLGEEQAIATAAARRPVAPASAPAPAPAATAAAATPHRAARAGEQAAVGERAADERAAGDRPAGGRLKGRLLRRRRGGSPRRVREETPVER